MSDIFFSDIFFLSVEARQGMAAPDYDRPVRKVIVSWTPQNHQTFSRAQRRAIVLLLLAQRHGVGHVGTLSHDVLLKILRLVRLEQAW
jgi:hypothetical protein